MVRLKEIPKPLTAKPFSIEIAEKYGLNRQQLYRLVRASKAFCICLTLFSAPLLPEPHVDRFRWRRSV